MFKGIWFCIQFIQVYTFQGILTFLSVVQFYNNLRGKRQINIRTTFLNPYHCVCCSGCSANVSLSSPEYLPFPAWIAVETGFDVKLVQSVDMWRWDTWLDTHIQPERSDHSFLQLIQTVVYSLPPFPLDEWFPHLWREKIITMVKQRGGRRRAEAWSKRIGRSLCTSKIKLPFSLL